MPCVPLDFRPLRVLVIATCQSENAETSSSTAWQMTTNVPQVPLQISIWAKIFKPHLFCIHMEYFVGYRTYPMRNHMRYPMRYPMGWPMGCLMAYLLGCWVFPLGHGGCSLGLIIMTWIMLLVWSGPNLGPSWLQLVSNWADVGPKLAPAWPKLASCWVSSGCPAAPGPTQGLPNLFPVASWPPKPPLDLKWNSKGPPKPLTWTLNPL